MSTMMAAGCGQLRDGLEGEGLERVTGEDGDGFSEGDVAGRLAAAEIVIVECGKVVVDERVGVDHLERGAEVGCAIGQCASDHAGGFHAEDRAKAFASGEGGSGAWRGGWSAVRWWRRAADARGRRR